MLWSSNWQADLAFLRSFITEGTCVKWVVRCKTASCTTCSGAIKHDTRPQAPVSTYFNPSAYFSGGLHSGLQGNFVACMAAEHLIFKLGEIFRHSGYSSGLFLYVDRISLPFASATIYTNEENVTGTVSFQLKFPFQPRNNLFSFKESHMRHFPHAVICRHLFQRQAAGTINLHHWLL